MKTIMLHGLGQVSSSWESTIMTMGKGFEILCPDLSDWLRNTEVSYYNLYHTFEKYCEDIDGPLNLCGLSLGGMLALQYAVEHGNRVNSLVLIGTQFSAPDNLLRFQNLIFRFMPESAFKETGFGKASMISLSKSMIGLDFYQDLKYIHCRTLVICGEKDRANRRASMKLKEQIPNAEISLIPNAGHEVNVDAPTLLGKELKTFFFS
ncbi:MAG: alpha/beta hydrolase [Oscillibacter sp.]|nr:alpha/beta hydrolase [Oscillibacter sp.]